MSAAAAAIVVEDEPQIRRFVRAALESEGWRVTEAATLKQGLTEAATRRPDLVVLDLALPDGDGIELVRSMRAWSGSPILVLSARGAEQDKIEALDSGADDYLTKPFGIGELLARVRALARRRPRAGADSGEPVFRAGDIEIDFSSRRVRRAGQVVHLTPIEYRLLALLAASADRVLTHRQILREVWGPAYVEHEHYARIYMGHLRRKLEADPARPRHLLTETAVGYRLVTG
ncbi:MAG: two-component system response regulator KdpE [Burkholderiaceae bacterium]|nr:two-component system response regulator KdpE [Burkholderiaceae bacterium]